MPPTTTDADLRRQLASLVDGCIGRGDLVLAAILTAGVRTLDSRLGTTHSGDAPIHCGWKPNP